jgi:ferredoxin
MQVLVDPVLCEANGRCVDVAPAVFELVEIGDDEVLEIHESGEGAEPDLLRRAVNSCPRNALRIDTG